jgi:hypothetical protein
MATKERSARRTTVILNEEERDYIDFLIREGKEPGIKLLISKMLDIYRNLMIDEWKYPGEYYLGISRVAFVNIEIIDTLLKFIPEDEWQTVGQKMGEATKISLETSSKIELTSREKWPDALQRLHIQGFGDFYLRDKFIIIRSPFISQPTVWVGFLEKLLGVSLEARTSTAPLIFEIRS